MLVLLAETLQSSAPDEERAVSHPTSQSDAMKVEYLLQRACSDVWFELAALFVETSSSVEHE